MSHTSTASAQDAEPTRQVRLHLPDHVYRALRHRLADAPPGTSISEVIVELIEAGLSNGGALT